jgi:hypothetical protein
MSNNFQNELKDWKWKEKVGESLMSRCLLDTEFCIVQYKFLLFSGFSIYHFMHIGCWIVADSLNHHKKCGMIIVFRRKDYDKAVQ